MPAILPSILFAAALQSYSGGDFALLDRWQGEARNDRFGNEISNAGDLNGDGIDDLLVSAPTASNLVLGSMGRVYVYSGADQTLIHSWEGIAEKVELGVSVANAGDVNGDGVDDVIAGANGNLTGVGAYAEVWSGADGSLLHHVNEVQADSYFGQYVAGAGDVNGDGMHDFIVSAIHTTVNGQENAGSAYVYSGADGSVLFQIEGVDINSKLGYGMAALGDVNNDGRHDFALSQQISSSGGMQPVVVIYSGIDGTPLFQIDSPSTNDAFGSTLESCPDLNGDGIRDLLIGAPKSNNGSLADAGAAYAYSGSAGTLLLEWQGQTAGENLGWSIAGGQDLNSDGIWDIAIGSQNYSDGAHFQAGAISLYSSNDGHLLHRVIGPNAMVHYGINLAVFNDSNGNGSGEFCTGQFNGGAQAQGVVKRFEFVNFLATSTQQIEARSGALIDFEYDFPAPASGYLYHTLVSASGVGPIDHVSVTSFL